MIAEAKVETTPFPYSRNAISVHGADRFVIQWVERQLGLNQGDLEPGTALGIIREGHIIAGVVYSDFREGEHGSSIQGSIASLHPQWCNRKVLRSIFAYPFQQIRVSRFWLSTSRKNKHARKFVERLGFRFEGIARRAHDGRTDAAVYSMLPHECRWLGGN